MTMTYKPKRLRFFNRQMEAYKNGNGFIPMGTPDEPRGTDGEDYNLLASLCDDGKHHPVLDIDGGMTVVESSTPGHYHLYFDDVALDWNDYAELLRVLAKFGLVDKEWATHSHRKGYSSVRPPHVKKGTPAPLVEPPSAPAGHWMTPPATDDLPW